MGFVACNEPVEPGQSAETEANGGGETQSGSSTGGDEGSGSDGESGSGSGSEAGTDEGSDTDEPPPDGGAQQWLRRLDTGLVAVAMDGDHVLVATATFRGGSVLRLDATDGSVLAEFPLPHTPNDIAALGDGRIAIAATVEADAWLGWFDAEGELLHAATFDGPAQDRDTGDALAVRDGALFLLSRETIDSATILDGAVRTVRRFDGIDEAWRVEVGDPGSHAVLSTAFAATGDGGFAAVGRAFTAANASELAVHRFSPTGTLAWEVTIPSSSTLDQVTPLAMATGADDRLAVAGHANWVYDFANGFIGHDAALLLLDGDGNVQHEIAVAAEPAWAAAIEHNVAHAVYNDVIVDANGGVIVAGETTESVIHVDETDLDYELRHLVLTKYDADGEEQWTRTYDAELAPRGAPAPSPFLLNVVLPEPAGTYGKSLAMTADDEVVVGGEQRMLSADRVSFVALHAD